MTLAMLQRLSLCYSDCRSDAARGKINPTDSRWSQPAPVATTPHRHSLSGNPLNCMLGGSFTGFVRGATSTAQSSRPTS
jgi:hypothetical protein